MDRRVFVGDQRQKILKNKPMQKDFVLDEAFRLSQLWLDRRHEEEHSSMESVKDRRRSLTVIGSTVDVDCRKPF